MGCALGFSPEANERGAAPNPREGSRAVVPAVTGSAELAQKRLRDDGYSVLAPHLVVDVCAGQSSSPRGRDGRSTGAWSFSSRLRSPLSHIDSVLRRRRGMEALVRIVFAQLCVCILHDSRQGKRPEMGFHYPPRRTMVFRWGWIPPRGAWCVEYWSPGVRQRHHVHGGLSMVDVVSSRHDHYKRVVARLAALLDWGPEM